MPDPAASPGVSVGDRVLFTGLGCERGRPADCVALFGARPQFASLRFDSGLSVLCLAGDCQPIPRRPPPMW